MTSDTGSDLTRASAHPFRAAGEFLRSRRERLTPDDVGLPWGTRRRTPGLRRDEVAMLADIGTTWYTWLEQGRDVRPSAEALSAVAKALKLDDVETCHLFNLHGRELPPAPAPLQEEVSAGLKRMLESLTGQPALVLGRRWDILAWNRAAEAVFGSYEALSEIERNSLYLLFLNPERRSLMTDWEEVARSSVAMFRADSARHAGDPDFDQLVEMLNSRSPEFARWWAECEVASPLKGDKRINHAEVGPMTFEYSSFKVEGSQDMRLMVFTPTQNDNTIKKLNKIIFQISSNY